MDATLPTLCDLILKEVKVIDNAFLEKDSKLIQKFRPARNALTCALIPNVILHIKSLLDTVSVFKVILLETEVPEKEVPDFVKKIRGVFLVYLSEDFDMLEQHLLDMEAIDELDFQTGCNKLMKLMAIMLTRLNELITKLERFCKNALRQDLKTTQMELTELIQEIGVHVRTPNK